MTEETITQQILRVLQSVSCLMLTPDIYGDSGVSSVTREHSLSHRCVDLVYSTC